MTNESGAASFTMPDKVVEDIDEIQTEFRGAHELPGLDGVQVVSPQRAVVAAGLEKPPVGSPQRYDRRR